MKTFAVALLYALGFVALITAQNSGGWMPIDPTNNDTVALAKVKKKKKKKKRKFSFCSCGWLCLFPDSPLIFFFFSLSPPFPP